MTMLLPWPDDIVPFRVMYYLQPHVGGSESPLTRIRKTYLLTAPRWIARLTFRGGYDGDVGEEAMGAYLDAWIAQLKGGGVLTAFHDWRRPYRRGAPAGWPLTNAAAAAGATIMAISGFPAGGYAYGRGDYIGGDGRAHIVVADAFADISGTAMVRFEPPLSVAVAAGAAIYDHVTTAFQLNGEDGGQNETEVGALTTYTLDFTEDLSDAA